MPPRMATHLILSRFNTAFASVVLRTALRRRISLYCLLLMAPLANSTSGQEPILFTTPSRWQRTSVAPTTPPPRERLPLRTVQDLPPVTPREASPSRMDFAALMRPTVSLAAESQAEASGVSLASYDLKTLVPTYPIFGPPPPFITAGFSYTDIDSPDAFGLPGDLYDYSLGLSWMRRVNRRWMCRFMFSAAMATDGNNVSSDAWQFRGGLFATHRPNDEWTWILGALALGRNDIPVVPAVGAIWQPSRAVRFDLTFPRPRASFLLVENGLRQQWGYLGAGLDGGTWAYERPDGIDDQLTYRDWRMVLGWESTPPLQPGQQFTRGRKFGAEIGYVFAREFEFESGLPDVDVDNTLVFRASMRF